MRVSLYLRLLAWFGIAGVGMHMLETCFRGQISRHKLHPRTLTFSGPEDAFEDVVPL
jgi:hypothetical protein